MPKELVFDDREVRSLFPARRDLELRVEGTSKKPRIVGYGAVFDEETELFPGSGFFEVVRRGAFLQSIERDDVFGLFEHREDRLLARSSAGTLELEEDDHGLRYIMEPRDASWIREDVLEPIRRRELRGSSFGFFATKDDVTRDPESRTELRELLEVTLVDVSPVLRPAYAGTEVSLRSQGTGLRGLLLALRRHGLDDPERRAELEATLRALEAPAPDPTKPEPGYYEGLRAEIPPPATGG